MDWLWRFRFGEDFLVEDFGLIVGLFCGWALSFRYLSDLGIPTSIYSLNTPGGAAFAGSDGLLVDFYENRVGVSAGEDASGDPAGLSYVYIEFEGFG